MSNRSRPRPSLSSYHPDLLPVQPPKGPEGGHHSLLQFVSSLLNHRQIQKEENADRDRSPQSPHLTLRPNLDVKKAMAYVLAHKNFSSAFIGGDPEQKNDDEPTRSYKTENSLETINIPDEKLEPLWRLEVERLIAGINNASTDIILPDTGIPDGDYTLLMSLAKDIRLLVIISRLLTETMAMREMTDLFEGDRFDSLQRRCDSLLRRVKASVDGKKAHDEAESTSPSQHTLSKERKHTAIFALIDYITLVLGKILVNSAPHNSTWCYTCLTSLVKYTSALKVLTKNPIGFATIVRSSAQDAIEYGRNFKGNQNNSSVREAAGLYARLNQQDTDQRAEDPLRKVYYGQSNAIQGTLGSFMEFVVESLEGATLVGTPRATFEICSVVYETGLERFRTWVYQERDGDLQATACQKSIPMARPAFQLLQSTAQALQLHHKLRRQLPPTTTNNHSSTSQTRLVKTYLHWNDISSDSAGNSSLADGHSPTHRIEIRNLAEAVTIMVPLLLVSPFVLTDLLTLFNMITYLGAEFSHTEPPVPPTEPGKFKAFFSLFTDGQIDVNERLRLQNASSLSKGLMTRDTLLRGRKIAEIHGQSFPQVNDPESRRRQGNLALEMDCSNREMDKWTFEETAVLVSCKLYVLTTMAMATLLAVCGVVVGFTVRGRVEAVDPFNITTYCWVLAAFGVLVAKSIRVETWPWRDFLHGHVRCRSVTELHSVTHIPEDFILCKLLDAEETSILKTRGPFNAAFERRDDGGFSIDRPLTMWTMLLSGLIMVQVDTDQEPGLVCLEVRRGTKYVSVDRTDNTKSKDKKEQLVCTDMSRVDSMLPLKRQIINWNRALGLYNNGDAKFV